MWIELIYNNERNYKCRNLFFLIFIKHYFYYFLNIMNSLNSDRMFIKWETQLEILKQLLTKSKNDAFRRDGIKKVISLKDKF